MNQNMEDKLYLKAQQHRQQIIDFAIINNRIRLIKNEEKELIDHICVSILPYQLDKQKLKQLQEEQKIWNELICKIAMDDQLIEKYFSKLQDNDSFIKKMYQIFKKVNESKFQRHNEICIIRNDFMMDQQLDKWLQIEYNLIACVYPHQANQLVEYHRTLYENYFKQEYEKYFNKQFQLLDQPLIDIRTEALSHAYKTYNNNQSVILFIVSDFESNIYEQRDIEFELLKQNMQVKRMTFEQINLAEQFIDQNGKYFINGQEISVIYFRNGYQEGQYQTAQHWQIRENMEISVAIKIPSVRFQLINFKIIQFLMDKDNIIEQKLEQGKIQQIRKSLAKIYEIDNQQQLQKLQKLVENNIDDYILKPQQEGGGNNYYNKEILEQFEQQSLESLQNHILMQKIKSKPQFGLLLKDKQIEKGQVTSELGLMGYFECNNKNILKNEVNGYLMRTKFIDINEGGVTCGYAGLDSILQAND